MARTVGVVIGRFQVAQLTPGHRHLIEEARKASSRLIILVGVSSVKNTQRYPLDYDTRRIMLRDSFPEAEIYPIHDTKDNDVWSKSVDTLIQNVTGSFDQVVIFGGRDSALSSYSGRHSTRAVEEKKSISGTEQREQLAAHPLKSENFRAGVIYASQNRWPEIHPTVDVAIYHPRFDQYLFGRKHGEKQWRLIGGFVDLADPSFEAAARREVYEETNCEVDNLEYLGSFQVSDWRYGREPNNTIMTTLFRATYVFGKPTAKDDIEELGAFSVEQIRTHLADHNFVTEHEPLIHALLTQITKETTV